MHNLHFLPEMDCTKNSPYPLFARRSSRLWRRWMRRCNHLCSGKRPQTVQWQQACQSCDSQAAQLYRARNCTTPKGRHVRLCQAKSQGSCAQTDLHAGVATRATLVGPAPAANGNVAPSIPATTPLPGFWIVVPDEQAAILSD